MQVPVRTTAASDVSLSTPPQGNLSSHSAQSKLSQPAASAAPIAPDAALATSGNASVQGATKRPAVLRGRGRGGGGGAARGGGRGNGFGGGAGTSSDMEKLSSTDPSPSVPASLVFSAGTVCGAEVKTDVTASNVAVLIQASQVDIASPLLPNERMSAASDSTK